MIDLASNLVIGSNGTLAILAGGESRRMGVAKSSLRIQGKPILQYLLESVRWPGPTLLITAPSREHPPGWELFDLEAVDAAEGEGPLRGILTALRAASTESVLISPVDMPAIGRDELSWILRELASRPELLGVMLSRRIGQERQTEPFPLACRRGAADLIAMQLQSNKRSVHSLAELREFVAIPAPEDWPNRVWTNLNSPGDFQAFSGKPLG